MCEQSGRQNDRAVGPDGLRVKEAAMKGPWGTGWSRRRRLGVDVDRYVSGAAPSSLVCLWFEHELDYCLRAGCGENIG